MAKTIKSDGASTGKLVVGLKKRKDCDSSKGPKQPKVPKAKK